MAQFYPPISVIKNMKPQPTEGEWKLLQFFAENYDNSYEVYFQPFLNEARPDVVVMRRGGGVMIIEVKDWDLTNYTSTPAGTWIVRANEEKVRYTPIRQVQSYKEKLYSLNSSELFHLRTIEGNKICWGLVNCAVFFHKSTEAQVHSLCFPPDITEKNKKFLKYVELWGDDSLIKKKIDSVFHKTYISRQSRYFVDSLYNDLKRLLGPDIHTLEQGLTYELSPVQQTLSESVAGARKRIKGVAGAGKSFVLARRAINAHKRTGGNVLILTYNITLKNYLHDRMSEVRENFDWHFFHIQNYHQQFNSMLEECSLSVSDIARAKWPELFRKCGDDDDAANDVVLSEEQLDEIYSDGSVFSRHRNLITRYDVILIDEAQDYQEDWVRILMEYVATDEAEIVAFADEKQNVYERELDVNRFPVIPIATGRWDSSLNTSYRLNTEIAELAWVFQRRYLAQKYVVDGKISPAKQLELIFDRAHIEYHALSPEGVNDWPKVLAEYVRAVIKAYKLHSNDLTVLSSSIDIVRHVGKAYGELTQEKVNMMCESQEEFDKIGGDPMRLKVARRFKKQNFWQNTGCVSFSSIHSFKGLESPAVVLIVGNGDLATTDDADKMIKLIRASAELTYVGISRTRNYLFVVNIGDSQYDALFKSAEVNKLLDHMAIAIPGADESSLIGSII